MTISANLHHLKSVEAVEYGPHSWLKLRSREGCEIAVHMDHRCAEMMAEAFEAYHDWLSGQEGPTFDDALGADLRGALMEEARKMK